MTYLKIAVFIWVAAHSQDLTLINENTNFVWSAKLIDNNGDGLPEDDRIPTSIAAVGNLRDDSAHDIYMAASGFIVGRRHAATVAHVFGSDGYWYITGKASKPSRSDFEHYWFYVDGCDRAYQVADIHVGSSEWNKKGNSHRDFAVVELAEDICSEVDPFPIARPSVEVLNANPLLAVGYYKPETVDMSLLSKPQNENGLFQQYASVATNAVHWKGLAKEEQAVFLYKLDQSFGGSGGPILSMVSGKFAVAGVQYRNGRPGKNYNAAIATDGLFLELLKTHVPDLSEVSLR